MREQKPFVPSLITSLHNQKMADALASEFIEDLADFIKDEVSMLPGVEDELKWLNDKIHVIFTVFNNAEGKLSPTIQFVCGLQTSKMSFMMLKTSLTVVEPIIKSLPDYP